MTSDDSRRRSRGSTSRWPASIDEPSHTCNPASESSTRGWGSWNYDQTMPAKILGLHHVTAITADAKANHDFYVNTLGLRLVKQTVNFDDPTSLHLYYGDETGSPGSIVTFFVHTGLPRGVVGAGEVGELFYEVPDHAKLRDNVTWAELPDPDGLRVRVVTGNPETDEQRLRLSQVVAYLPSVGFDASAAFLEKHLGFTDANPNVARIERVHLSLSANDYAAPVRLEANTGRHRPGAGTIHHIAFRIATEDEQLALREELVAAGVNVSPVMDRQYFKSIYFREPGGILLEVATDGPGFAVDEDASTLGTKLCLPPQFEAHREQLEQVVPWIRPAQQAQSAAES